MKKLSTILLTGLLATCVLAGCGDKGGDEGTGDDIVIFDPEVVRIEITTQPTKTTYEEFEMFDPSGMVVTAIYDDDSTEVIPSSQYVIKPSGPLTPSTTQMRIIDKESDEEAYVPITVNAGAEVTDDPQLWIEAEKTTMFFGSGDTLTCASAYQRNADASGGVILKNFGKYGNSLSMKVNSTVAGKTKMVFKVCKRPKTSVSFSSMYTVKVNDIVYPVDSTLEAGAAGNYFELTEFSSYVYFKEGLNTVVIQALNDTGANLDAFGFASNVSTITDGGTVQTIQHQAADSPDGIYVTKEPSMTETGEYTDGCVLCGEGSTGKKTLPVLSDQAYTFNNGKYTITLDGHDFEFSSKFRFECEDMALAGTVSTGSGKNKPVEAQYVIKTDCDTASGGKCLYNMNYLGNTITLNLISDKACTAKLRVCVAARVNSDGKAFTIPFDEMYTTTLNGSVLPNCNVDVVPSVGNNKALGTSFEFHVIELGNVNLLAGANTLVFTTTHRNDAKHTMSAGNLDYVEFLPDGVATLSLPQE